MVKYLFVAFFGIFLALHVGMFLAFGIAHGIFWNLCAFFDIFVQQGSLVTTNHRLGWRHQENAPQKNTKHMPRTAKSPKNAKQILNNCQMQKKCQMQKICQKLLKKWQMKKHAKKMPNAKKYQRNAKNMPNKCQINANKMTKNAKQC